MDEEKERQDNETSDPLRRLINKILINKMSYEDEIDEGTGYLIGSVITLIILLLYFSSARLYALCSNTWALKETG